MQQSHGPSVDKEVKQLTALLTLTADQQTQVKAILTDQKQQIETLFKPPAKSTSGKASDDDQLPSREAMEAIRTSIKTIREDTRTKIAALLTADQQTKFAAWAKKQAKSQSQQDDDMPPPPPDGDGGPPDGGGGPPGGGGPGGGGPPGI
jgi:Spy/CpxP family protein refolding chaperone